MIQKFRAESFEFAADEVVPAHIDSYPGPESERDPTKYQLEGFDTFEGESYPLAINIDTSRAAELLRQAALRSIEKTQPTSGSGDGEKDIQDTVYIIPPESTQ